MANFLYLFRSDQDKLKAASPAQMEQNLKDWMSWMEELKKGGHLVQPGNRLENTGKVLRGKSKSVTDGPYAEAKDTIGGYMIVSARDLEEATALARGCPIYERDGAVEVRPILQM